MFKHEKIRHLAELAACAAPAIAQLLRCAAAEAKRRAASVVACERTHWYRHFNLMNVHNKITVAGKHEEAESPYPG